MSARAALEQDATLPELRHEVAALRRTFSAMVQLQRDGGVGLLGMPEDASHVLDEIPPEALGAMPSELRAEVLESRGLASPEERRCFGASVLLRLGQLAREPAEQRRWFLEAAERGSSEALVQLGELSSCPQEQQVWWLCASLLCNREAMRRLGNLAGDVRERLDWREKAEQGVQEGCAKAGAELLRLLPAEPSRGLLDTLFATEGPKLLLWKAAARGDAKAMLVVAELCGSPARRRDWLRRAAELEEAEAADRLGLSREALEARRECFVLAAQHGDQDAAIALALFEEDPERKRYWQRRALELGCSERRLQLEARVDEELGRMSLCVADLAERLAAVEGLRLEGPTRHVHFADARASPLGELAVRVGAAERRLDDAELELQRVGQGGAPDAGEGATSARVARLAEELSALRGGALRVQALEQRLEAAEAQLRDGGGGGGGGAAVAQEAHRAGLAEELTAMRSKICKIQVDIEQNTDTIEQARHACDAATAELRSRLEVSLDDQHEEQSRVSQELERLVSDLQFLRSQQPAGTASPGGSAGAPAERAAAGSGGTAETDRQPSQVAADLAYLRVRLEAAESALRHEKDVSGNLSQGVAAINARLDEAVRVFQEHSEFIGAWREGVAEEQGRLALEMATLDKHCRGELDSHQTQLDGLSRTCTGARRELAAAQTALTEIGACLEEGENRYAQLQNALAEEVAALMQRLEASSSPAAAAHAQREGVAETSQLGDGLAALAAVAEAEAPSTITMAAAASHRAGATEVQQPQENLAMLAAVAEAEEAMRRAVMSDIFILKRKLEEVQVEVCECTRGLDRERWDRDRDIAQVACLVKALVCFDCAERLQGDTQVAIVASAPAQQLQALLGELEGLCNTMRDSSAECDEPCLRLPNLFHLVDQVEAAATASLRRIELQQIDAAAAVPDSAPLPATAPIATEESLVELGSRLRSDVDLAVADVRGELQRSRAELSQRLSALEVAHKQELKRGQTASAVELGSHFQAIESEAQKTNHLLEAFISSRRHQDSSEGQRRSVKPLLAEPVAATSQAELAAPEAGAEQRHAPSLRVKSQQSLIASPATASPASAPPSNVSHAMSTTPALFKSGRRQHSEALDSTPLAVPPPVPSPSASPVTTSSAKALAATPLSGVQSGESAPGALPPAIPPATAAPTSSPAASPALMRRSTSPSQRAAATTTVVAVSTDGQAVQAATGWRYHN